MKYLLLILGLLSFNFTDAQETLELKIDNPSPRVGDKVELSFSFKFFSDEIKNQLSDDIVVSSASPFYGAIGEDFTRNIEFTKEGTHTVGPFHFEFNGKTIVTDSITVDVASELPYEEGAWIRIVRDEEGNQFLIIEQLIQNESNYSEDENGFTYSVGGELNEGAKLAEFDNVNVDGLRIDQRRSMTNTRTDKNANLFSAGLTYSFIKYEIILSDGFSGSFKLKKKHFKNIPRKVHISDLTITK